MAILTPASNAVPSASPATSFDDPVVAQQAKNFTKAVFQHESGGDFNAVGDNSTSHGAGQWQPDTWKGMAKDVLGDENAPMTAQNQSVVAQGTFRKWFTPREKGGLGLNAAEAAAKWNSGSEYGWENKVGTTNIGGKQIKYNVPLYVKQVTDLYQQLKNSPQMAQGGGNLLGGQTAEASTGNTPEAPESTLGKLIDFAFPIIKDIQTPEKTTGLQKLGDLGLSALWFVPGLGEGAGAAIRGAGLLGETGAKIAGHVLGGAATGYGADVASKLSQGQTDAGVLTPGIGTATGGALGGVLGKVASKYSPSDILDQISKSNANVLGATKTGTKILTKSAMGGKDPATFLAGKGLNLQQYVNPETLHYDFSPVTSQLGKESDALDEVLTDALKHAPGTVKLKDLETRAMQAVDNQANREEGTVLKRQQQIKDEIDTYRKIYGKEVSLSDLNGIKRGQRRVSGIFDASKPQWSQDVNYQLSKVAQGLVEEGASKAGLDGVPEFNQYLGSHLDALKALNKLNGTAAKGGKLGYLFQQQALTGLGGITGMFGGGPVGAILGGIAGHYGSKFVGNAIRKVSASPLRSALLRRAVQEDPQIVQKLQQYIGQAGTIAPFIGQKAPKAGIVSQLLGQSAKGGLIGTGARIGAQFNSQTPMPAPSTQSQTKKGLSGTNHRK